MAEPYRANALAIAPSRRGSRPTTRDEWEAEFRTANLGVTNRLGSAFFLLRFEPLHRAGLRLGSSRLWLGALLGRF
jgi:hypothetical protein